MTILDPSEAQHFASGLGNTTVPPASFRNWINGPSFPRHFQEGTANFDIFRELSLAEVERLLLLSASHYRRAHDLFGEASSSWAFVTLYYGAYFSASALLGMFGAWKLRASAKAIEPIATSSGMQRFEIVARPSSYKGSHQQFWEFFYFNAKFIKPYVATKYHFALNPISGDITWPIKNRNDLNYDSFAALQLASAQRATFNVAGFPASLPGVLSTQFRFFESLLAVTGTCAQSVGIETSALAALSVLANRVARIEELVLSGHSPKLGNRVKRRIACTAGA